MPRAGRAGLSRLELLEEPQAWAALGFSIDAGARCAIGNTEVVLRGGAGGIAAWGLSGLSSVELDGLPTMLDAGPSPARAQSAVHPNGCVGIDHVVVRTPDPSRTFGTLERAGLELRRTRDVPGAHPPLVQGFLPLANALVEVVGPREPDAADGRAPASFWGVTLVVADLDATAQLLGDRVGPVRDAVQPGRRIATVRASATAIRTPLAFMSPRA